MSRELREEIERQDAALGVALEAVRRLESELSGKRGRDADRLAALGLEERALQQESERLQARDAELRAERAALQGRIADGRAAFARTQAQAQARGPREPPATTWRFPANFSTRELLEPTSWRKGQPWYVRLLYWFADPPEWK
jgi:septal ring factor EnvC (AmiA/AmiB activator)